MYSELMLSSHMALTAADMLRYMPLTDKDEIFLSVKLKLKG